LGQSPTPCTARKLHARALNRISSVKMQAPLRVLATFSQRCTQEGLFPSEVPATDYGRFFDAVPGTIARSPMRREKGPG
jgi:hypothetical protein